MSFPFGTIYRRQDCQVEDDYLENIGVSLVGVGEFSSLPFITDAFWVLFRVSVLSLMIWCNRPGIRFIHSTRTEPFCVANSQDKIRLNFAVRSRSRVFAVGLEIQK